ncbi:cyclin-dependent kinase 4 inhibitor C isoform 1-T4 [Odontesthes bonariensis]|uniref:cyclin-dependent kinase 4 inhibitor C n=1 Tax=Odontesthes bonariensis TaxID=219752 RepID=UPI003F58D24D
MTEEDELCKASARGERDKVLSILQRGVNVSGFNSFNRTALQVVKLGDSQLIKVLLEAGADPNLPDPVLKLTVTHDAAREGFVESVRALMDHGADVNLVDENGNLPLHLAAREGHLHVVKLLIPHTASPRAANIHGFTAWQLARDFKRVETAEYIEEYLGSNKGS